MLIYFVLYFLIALVAVLFNLLCNEIEHKNKYISLSIFFLIFVLLALRHQSMGVDLNYTSPTGYLGSFDKIASYSWREVLILKSFLNYEKGYVVLNKLIGSISKSRQFFLAVIAFISTFPILRLIRKKSTDPTFSYIIFLGLPLFTMFFSGLRQGIAIGICAYSYMFIVDKKPIKFLISVLFASLFHATALIFLIAYILYHIKINNICRIISIGLIAVVYIFKYPLFDFATRIIGKNIDVGSSSAFVLLAVFTLIYMFGFAIGSEDKKQNGYMNIFYMACLFQTFGSISPTITRVGYYFALSLILLLPNVIDSIKDTQTRNILKIVTIYCFVAFGLYNIYSTTWAMANPYIFFWK